MEKIKCIVKGCKNHKLEGNFVGDLCSSCHYILTEGYIMPSHAWFIKDLCDLHNKLDKIRNITDE